MKIANIIKNLNGLKRQKSLTILQLCKEYLQFENIINFDQNKVEFPKQNKEISMRNILTDAFLSKLASIEFGYNGWVFTCGSSKAIMQNTIIEAEKFGKLCGNELKSQLATGSTSSFMEIINRGYNESGNFAITSTTFFPSVNDKVNKEIRYCFTASTFVNMEAFLVQNAIAGVFFEGGIGTAYEAFSILIERQRGSIPKNTPIIFVTRGTEECIFHNTLQVMQKNGKICASDLENLYFVQTAQEAFDILSQYEIFHTSNNENNVKHEFIREIFAVSSDRYI